MYTLNFLVPVLLIFHSLYMFFDAVVLFPFLFSNIELILFLNIDTHEYVVSKSIPIIGSLILIDGEKKWIGRLLIMCLNFGNIFIFFSFF